jgi:hypothetical protein
MPLQTRDDCEAKARKRLEGQVPPCPNARSDHHRAPEFRSMGKQELPQAAPCPSSVTLLLLRTHQLSDPAHELEATIVVLR